MISFDHYFIRKTVSIVLSSIDVDTTISNASSVKASVSYIEWSKDTKLHYKHDILYVTMGLASADKKPAQDTL